jgi:D-tyrosyl-tRNA(Tyr) deacylase
MRAVIQRVSHADVAVNHTVVGKIGKGILVLLGIDETDHGNDLEYMVDKIIHLRIFEDENDKMNLSLLDVHGELLVISQFTLLGDCRKGRRPSFTHAAKPDKANDLYKKFIEQCESYDVKVASGIFQADMQVNLCNDGPVTILLDSKKVF